MRNIPLVFWLGLTFAVVSCDDGSAQEPSVNSCGAGKEICGSTCVPQGSCPYNLGGASSAAAGGAQPADPGPFSNPDCGDSSSDSSTLSAQYAGVTLNAGSGKQYRLSTNWWGKYNGQTVSYQGLSFAIGNPNDVASSDNNPIGFPTLYIGTYSGVTTAGSNLPKQVSALTTVPTVLSTNAADLDRRQYNATYDVWFTPNSTPLNQGQYAPPSGGAYLMVWLFKPLMRQPRGSLLHPNRSIPGVEGTWDVWIDSSNPPCISYVSVNPLNGLSFDLNSFIQHSVTNSYGITSSMYLSVVFAGFEVWADGDGLRLKNFCAKVN